MGAIGNCCCCELTLETLPDWQLEGYEVTEDWNTDRTGPNGCCWEREYEAIGNYNAGLITSADITRFWVNEQTRTDALALSKLVSWTWKGPGAPPGLPPGPLCPQDAGIIGYTTCDYTMEHKRRAYLYYQPWRIRIALSQAKDRCDEEEPIRNIYTLSVSTEYRHRSAVQTHFRECIRRNFYVTNECYERNSRPNIESGCESTGLDYATLTPASDFVAWDFFTIRTNVIHQFEEIPDSITIDSHDSPINEEEWLECIFGTASNCHAFGPGVIDGQNCWTFDEANVEPIPDSTPYVQIVSFTQQDCAPYGDCSPPTYGYDLQGKVYCTDTGFTTFRITTADPPLCSQTWGELRPQTTSVPPGGATTAFCNTQGGDPRFAEIWYKLKDDENCCSDAIPCPPDGEGGGGPIPIDIDGNPILPTGYETGWYGGVYCVEPGKWSVVSYEVESEFLPINERTLCIPSTDFVFEVPE